MQLFGTNKLEYKEYILYLFVAKAKYCIRKKQQIIQLFWTGKLEYKKYTLKCVLQPGGQSM